jgi:uronate dehydrogenase
MTGNATTGSSTNRESAPGERAPGERVLITGAAGRLGRMLRARLPRDRHLRLLDTVPPAAGDDPPDGGVEIVTASITDLDAMCAACRDVDAVVHLAAHSVEGRWQDILEANIDGTRCVLEAARREGVGRMVMASSNHAVGFWTRDEASADGLPAGVAPRPDTYYGVSKATMEALGSLYHSRFGMDVSCLRIGSCDPRPRSPRALATWLSPDDFARLVVACLSTPVPGFRILWGVSRNTRRWWSLAEGEAIGYHPVDDAERFAGELLAGGEPDPDDPLVRFLGGSYCRIPLGEPA